MGILIQGGRIVDAATDTDKKGDIYLEDGVITEIGETPARPPEHRCAGRLFGGGARPLPLDGFGVPVSPLRNPAEHRRDRPRGTR